MSYFLGIDGGGSKTACAIGDETALLGTGSSLGSNVVRVGEARAREAIHTAIRQACAAASVIPANIENACIGIAGAARPMVLEVVRRVVSELIPGDIEIVGDMEIALEAAFDGGPGVVVIAGTGSIAYGRDVQGRSARAGGWGFAVSDEGSGHWIGRAAVAGALRAQDQGESPFLFEEIAKAWKLTTREQVVLAANATPPPDFAALLSVVLDAADSGDQLACNLLTKAGSELSTLAQMVIDRLFKEVASVPVAMSGGVFANSALVREAFYNSLHSVFPRIVLNPTMVDPVQGALALARKANHR